MLMLVLVRRLGEELKKEQEFMTSVRAAVIVSVWLAMWFFIKKTIIKKEQKPKGLVRATLDDSVFLIIWVLAQALVNQVVVSFPLPIFDQWTLFTLQVLFAIATLIPIIAHICLEAVKYGVQTRKAMNKELEQLE